MTRFRRPSAPGVAWLACAALAACATPQTDRLLEAPGALPTHVELLDVPFYAQRTDECGPASLAMALGWSGVDVTPDALVREVYAPERRGSLQADIVSAARRHGRLAYPVRDLEALMTELAAGHPVLVLQNLGLRWPSAWHYAVAVGYDLDRATLELHSGRQARRRVELRLFERTWARGDRWALVVLPPTLLPASADPASFVEAVLGLERVGRNAEAEAAYRTALERWPDSAVLWLGLGNRRYAGGDLEAAERAFRAATEGRPESAPAWNNLAHVLLERGRRDEARGAALRAIALGGPLAARFRETLEAIERATPTE